MEAPTGLDRGVPTPVYVQIADLLRHKIADGEWPAHHRLTTEPELARQLGVSRGTLRKALDILLAEGLLRRVHGRGTFVLPTDVAAPLGSELGTVAEELAKVGIAFTTTVLERRIVPAPAEVASHLALQAGTPTLRLERVRTDDLGPIAYLVNYVRTHPGDGLAEADFEASPLFAYLEDRLGWPIRYGRRTVWAVAATGELAGRLAVPIGAPLLLLEQVTHLADDTPVEFSHVWINPARMKVSSVVQRAPR